MNMSATFDLFEGMAQGQIRREELCPGAVILRGFAAEKEAAIFTELQSVTADMAG
jgi:alkylated DNA repair protein (DNA oxidative demethylase)